MFCREHVAQLRDNEQAFAETGATVTLVGTGDVEYGRMLAEHYEIPFPVLIDEELESYRLVGTGKGSMFDMVKPGVVVAAARTAAGGTLQGKLGPHPLVLGATHIVLPDGTVPFAWVNDDYADNAPVSEVLAALG